MATVLKQQDNGWEQVLYMALELSNTKWKLAFSAGDRIRKKSMDAGDLAALEREIGKAKQRFGLSEECRVVSVYEAGRDGFWIHRALEGRGIESLVVDSASIEVNRKQRRAKTDNVDVEALIRQLMRFAGGEKRALSVVRVPTVQAEDQRRLHRERERVLTERGAHSARIKSLLIAQGIRRKVTPELLEELEELSSPAGYPLGEDLKAEIRREYERYRLADEQIRGLERTQRERLEADPSGALQQVRSLLQLRGVGWVSSWTLVMEFFAWRGFRNRKQLAACAGLTPTPYSSGDMERDQGISKAGNRHGLPLLGIWEDVVTLDAALTSSDLLRTEVAA